MVEGSAATAALVLAGAGIALSLALACAQAFMGAQVGTDHPVHVFLTRNIRDSGYRLFVRIPRLLNTCYCAAVPLYLHWIVSHFRAAAVYWCERLLNPSVNALHVGLFALLALLAARAADLPPGFVALATCAFALTPQFYHALSARNFGLSSRGTGLLLLTLFYLAAWATRGGTGLSWVALAVCGWLVFGFSTFAQQALCLIGALLLAVSRDYVPLAGALLGLALFIVLHPRYSLGYLTHTLRFIRTYRRELAPIYILASRYSIWGDLVRGIWAQARHGPLRGARYAYGNSVLIVLMLNPLCVLTCWMELTGSLPAHSLMAYAGALTLAGTLAMLLTSFRATRFLGESERYVEAITPWGVLCGSYVLYSRGPALLAAATALFLLMDLAQLGASRLLLRRVGGQTRELAEVEAAVRQRLPAGVRFCSNNEQLTKLLMQNDWQYAYCLAAGSDYCGMNMQEAFATFPLLRREACERIVATYRVNACLLDRTVFESLFDTQPAGLRGMSVAYESSRLRLLILDWASAPA